MFSSENIDNIYPKFSKTKNVFTKSTEIYDYNQEEKETFYIHSQSSQIKSTLKITIIILLFSFKLFYPINMDNNLIEDNIENIFPKNYNKTNEQHYAKEYFKLCQNGTLMGKTRYKRNSKPKFTVITPVYNKEDYITRVLRSIQNQSYKNIEIIFIDDNSEDNSVKIIKQYQRKDKRIRLITHTKNQGTLKFLIFFIINYLLYI